jgi:hypothetical protein
MHITVEKQYTGFFSEMPLRLRYAFTEYKLQGWLTGARTPVSLGIVYLPNDVDIKEIEDLLNADV